MRWPWQRASRGERLVVSWAAQTVAYVLAKKTGNSFSIVRAGVELQGADTREDFIRRLAGLGLKGYATDVMLLPEQYQLLQIEAPAVAPEELRSAVRYQIKDMVDVHLDDLTLDVLRVGDAQGRAASQLFVVSAHNAVLREVMELAAALQWDVRVVDVQDMAQRNLQSVQELERASCALFITQGRQALLTISAGAELYYSRRLDLPEGFLGMTWTAAATTAPAPLDAYTPVEEYVPDYAGGGYASDFSTTGAVTANSEQTDIDRAQRVLVEVQRSIDLWERTWPQLTLAGVQVFAGERSLELAEWLSRDTGQPVNPMDAGFAFSGWEQISAADMPLCLPLVGVLLRTDARKA